MLISLDGISFINNGADMESEGLVIYLYENGVLMCLHIEIVRYAQWWKRGHRYI